MATSLSDFIRSNKEPILAEWETFARTCTPASDGMDIAALRDHAELMLDWIADDLETPQTEKQQDIKARGLKKKEPGECVATLHGELRHRDQFTMPQVFAEFRALRASVIRLWTNGRQTANAAELKDFNRFHEAIDQLLAESVARFSASVEESRDMFDAILGHDLRNPLGAIMMSATFIRAAMPPQAQTVAMAQRILTSGERMRRLITNLLDLSRVRMGGDFSIAPENMNMEEVCREVVEEILAAYPEKNVRIETTGKISGRWDRERVGQVVSNLISNALQHGSKESPVLVSLIGDTDEVLLRVHNRGSVIPRADFQRIFEPSTRLATGSEETSFRGSLGLGLHIARVIVEKHGGTIEVESSKEKGTVFTVHWPRG